MDTPYDNNRGIKIKTFIDDVVSKNNGLYGIYVAGTGFFTIRNVEAVNNAVAGMRFLAFNPGFNPGSDITLDGQVHLNNNGDYGLQLINFQAAPTTVNVVGDLVTDRNGLDGITIAGIDNDSPDVTVVLGDSSSSGKSGKVGSSGSVKACMNGEVDIDDTVGNFEGDDYTCDGDLSKCNECYPGCFA